MSTGLYQTLSAMLIQLQVLQAQLAKESDEVTLDTASLREGLRMLEQMTREMFSLLRSLSDDLPLPELDGITLNEALSNLVEQTAETLGLSSRVSFSSIDGHGGIKAGALSRATERVLYLIAQEALYQVRQHLDARKLRLTLDYRQTDVQMSIEDDGRTTYPQAMTSDEAAPAPPFTGGEAANASSISVSIINDLRYRLEHLGGSLEIDALGTQGTRVMARVPYTRSCEQTSADIELRANGSDTASQTDSATTMVDQIRILLVDSQTVTRAGLRRLLESYPGLQVIGEAADGVQAVSETLELGPQIVLMDTQLPNGQSLEALRQIKQLNLNTKVLLLSAQDREAYLYEILRAGADGYVLKDIAPDELAQAVRRVARGEVLVQPWLAGKLLSHLGRQRYSQALTTRELEVLRLLARGLRNKAIATQLSVSERTVNFHLANIYQKLNVSGRTEALSKALEQGLITA